MAQQFGMLQTLYESRERKGIRIKFNNSAAHEIDNYLSGLENVIQEYKNDPEIMGGLNELKSKANAILISNTPEEEILNEIRKMTTITGPDGKKLSIIRKKSEKLDNEDVFKQRALKRLNQTKQNSVALMQWKPDNPELGKFLKDLQQVDTNMPARELDRVIKSLVNNPGFKSYQSTKDAYLKEWLKPFQAELGKPIEALSQEELQEAMKRMKVMMNQRMTEGNLIVYSKSDEMREFNQKDHDMVNGNERTFWLNDMLIDEFIGFTNAVLSKFTFLLDKQYLIFQFKNEPYLYLIGFSQQALTNAIPSDDGSLLIAPHVKAIIQGKDKHFRELAKENFPSVGLYIDVIKDTLKPFFRALAEKVEFQLSKDFQQHFRM